MTSSKEKEEFIVAIEKDDVEYFIDHSNNFPNWNEIYLSDLDLFLLHFAACR